MFWEGDQSTAFELARLIADIEPEKSKYADILFCGRPGATIDNDTALYVSKKFNVWTHIGYRKDQGYPAGCNAVWFDVIHHSTHMHQCGKFDYLGVLTVETDCCPIKKDWIKRIRDEYVVALEGKKRFLGHVFTEPENKEHLNGVAVYPPRLALDPDGNKFQNCPSYLGWDWYYADYLTKQAMPSKEVYLDFKRGSITEELLYAPKFRPEGNPLHGIPLYPSLYHGVKDGTARAIARKNLCQ